ncbi:hypothetical protein Xoosp13_285 [Xanthomonas phage Xoo-sp13]|nr:hypothetical protein Xoosp13_285 [Xanthomonas phage Xoo-sp13]
MRLLQFLSEAFDVGSVYNAFGQAFRDQFNESPPSAAKLTGLLNRRVYKAGQDAQLDFVTNWFLKKGLLQQKGSMVVPTPRGSELRQSLAAPSRDISDKNLTKAAGQGYKALRRYFMDVTDVATREFLESLDENTVKAIGIARELTQEDIAIITGLRTLAANHRDRSTFIDTIRQKNSERFDRLVSLGFIDPKGTFNKSVWDKFIETINKLDPARIKTLIPQFYEWATHTSGNTARNINRILFAIHPKSRNRTEKGRLAWEIVKNLDQNTFTLLQNGKKPRQGDLNDESYELLTTVVASVVRSFPNVKSVEDFEHQVDAAFDSRVDFKSLDRSSDKVASRRQGVRNTFNR